MPFRLSWCLLLAAFLPAQVQVHPLFGDHMVLQQGRTVPIWGTAPPGEQVTLQFAGQKLATKADEAGRWSVELAPLKVGEPRSLVVAATNKIVFQDVLVGEVWLCSGQSNMEWPLSRANKAEAEIAAAEFPRIRLFQVGRNVRKEPVHEPKSGSWQICSPKHAGRFSAVGYFFGRHLQQRLHVPVGLIQSAYGGTPAEAWTSSQALAAPEFKRIQARWQQIDTNYAKWQAASATARARGQEPPPAPRWQPSHRHRASGLFNGMIAPLLPFRVRGVIWYQGEANVGRAWQYRKLFPALIQDWRRAFGQEDLPFLWVQLAPYRYGRHDKKACAELWEAQSMTLSLPHTAQAVALDLGDPKDIHPRNKQEVGRRLGLCAEAVVYGHKVVWSGPVFRKLRVEGARAILEFDHVHGGLVSGDNTLTLAGFEIAGKDENFLPARAVVRGNTVVVNSDRVPEPVAVRYAWHDTATASLYNKAGLPAASFRTDNWPGVTDNGAGSRGQRPPRRRL